MKARNLIRDLAYLFVFVFFIGCSDNPKDIGENLVNEYLKIDTLDSYKDSLITKIATIKQNADLSFAKRYLIGKEGKIKTSALLKFDYNFNQTIKNALIKDSIEIIEAKVNLFPTYFYGEKKSNWNFEMFVCYRDWNSDKFNLDSLNIFKGNGIDLTKNYVYSINYSDTIIKANINSLDFLSILKGEADTNYKKTYGFYLTSNSSPIIGFPTVTAGFGNKLAKIQTIYKYNNKIDTMYFVLKNDIHIFEEYEIDYDSNYAYIQGGIQTIALIKFDVSKLPAKSSVVKALFELPVDTIKSKFGKPSESVYIARFVLDANNTNIKYDSTRALYFSMDKNIIKGTITSYVQAWLNGSNNNGIYLNVANYYDHCDLTAIRISNSTELKPRLRIIYATK